MLMKEKDKYLKLKFLSAGKVFNSTFFYMNPVNTRKQQRAGREREKGTKDDIYIYWF